MVYKWGDPGKFSVIETKGTGLQPIAENPVKYEEEEPLK